MSWYHPTTLLDKVFEGGIILKGIHAGLEFLGGVLLLFVSPATIHKFILLVDRGGPFQGSRGKTFVIAYLWIHAVIKLIAVIGLLKNVLWAYPFSLITLGLFMLYQLYLVYLKVSIGLMLLTAFDIFILWLIWREYGKVRVALAKAR